MTDEQEEKTEILRAFAWRLGSAADARGLQQNEIAEHLGVKAPRVRNWFQGLNRPKRAERVSLAKLLQVPYDWLYKETTDLDRAPDPTVTEEQARFGGEAIREVPVISWTHAGTAAAYEEMPRHFQDSVATTCRGRKVYGLKVEGDSMEPRYNPGDVVILNAEAEPRNGKGVVVKFVNDAVQIRLYHKLSSGKIRLTSMKPDRYPTDDYSPKDFHWIHPVFQTISIE